MVRVNSSAVLVRFGYWMNLSILDSRVLGRRQATLVVAHAIEQHRTKILEGIMGFT
jgi:hypothetical protein